MGLRNHWTFLAIGTTTIATKKRQARNLIQRTHTHTCWYVGCSGIESTACEGWYCHLTFLRHVLFYSKYWQNIIDTWAVPSVLEHLTPSSSYVPCQNHRVYNLLSEIIKTLVATLKASPKPAHYSLASTLWVPAAWKLRDISFSIIKLMGQIHLKQAQGVCSSCPLLYVIVYLEFRILNSLGTVPPSKWRRRDLFQPPSLSREHNENILKKRKESERERERAI